MDRKLIKTNKTIRFNLAQISLTPRLHTHKKKHLQHTHTHTGKKKNKKKMCECKVFKEFNLATNIELVILELSI